VAEPSQDRLRADLGLGGKLSERSRARLVNRDGTFNVRRNDLSSFHHRVSHAAVASDPAPAGADGQLVRRDEPDVRGVVLPGRTRGAGRRGRDTPRPLRGLHLLQRSDAGHDRLRPARPEPDDETFAQKVHAKTSFDESDVVWGARFTDMYLADEDRVAIDLNRLHDFESVDMPVDLSPMPRDASVTP
jgi:hypothetical protein